MAKKSILPCEWQPSLYSLPYKIFYFTFYAGYMPLLLFLPVYFKYIGLNPVHVGILNGLRPILQSVGTPVLVFVGEKFNSRKLVLVISCIVMIGKVLIIFLFLRPSNQVCAVKYINETRYTVEETSHVIEHKLSKRAITADVFTHWDWNDTATKTTTYSDRAKKLLRRTKTNLMNDNFDDAIALDTPFVTNSSKENKTQLNGTANPSMATIRLPQPTETRKNVQVIYHVVNDQDEVNRIFIGLVILVLLGDWFDSTVFTLVDHSCVANMDVENYGFIRLWGNLGWGIMTPVIGGILYKFRHEFCGSTIDSFHYVFFFFIGFCYIALLVGSHLDFTGKPTDVLTSKIHDALSNFQYGMFLFASAYSGFCNGFLFTFVNWFIDSLGGNALVMGISTGCKCLVDVVLFFLLGKIIETLGHVAVMSAGFVGYILVFLIYFAIDEAWLVVFAETIHAIVYALMTSSSVAFLIYAAPAGSSPKMQGILQGIYWGIGTGCGAIFGGYCVKGVGFPRTFLSFTVITCVVAFIFLIIQLLSYANTSNKERTSSTGSSSTYDGDDEGDFSDPEEQTANDEWRDDEQEPNNR